MVASKPSVLKGTIIQYIIESLLIHLDDTDSDFQARVYHVLVCTAKIDSASLERALNMSKKSCINYSFMGRLSRIAF